MVLQSPDISENLVGVVSVVCIFVLFPLVIAYSRGVWKRAGMAPSKLGDDSALRLAQMQHSIDAMAIELERISENQRFVTKLLSDKAQAAQAAPAPSSRSGRGAD